MTYDDLEAVIAELALQKNSFFIWSHRVSSDPVHISSVLHGDWTDGVVINGNGVHRCPLKDDFPWRCLSCGERIGSAMILASNATAERLLRLIRSGRVGR